MSKQINLTCAPSLILIFLAGSTIFYLSMAPRKIVSVDFEVFGRVQGVFFRKYTQQQAQNLGLKGWCMNTDQGTVLGNMEGDETAVQSMKVWLEKSGSPQSRIEKAEFSNEKQVKGFTHSDFKIRR